MLNSLHEKYNCMDFNALHDDFQTKKCKLFMPNGVRDFFA